MALENTLAQFADTFGRDGVDSGEIRIEQHTLAVSEPTLEGDLKTFYSLVSFDKLVVGGELFLELFPAEKLRKAQDGWFYITNPKDGKVSEDTTHWNKNWIVIGDRNGDAIFCKQDEPNTPVYGSIQKTNNLLLADSLEGFFQILNGCLLVEQSQFAFETQTDDFVPKEDFIDAVRQAVSQYSDAGKADEFISFFFE